MMTWLATLRSSGMLSVCCLAIPSEEIAVELPKQSRLIATMVAIRDERW